MEMNQPGMTVYKTAMGCSLIFAVLFLYYLTAGTFLPRGAGPDYTSHNDIVEFISQHGRLAVLPRDEDKLHFTHYGGTRALRPPLSYIVAAGVASIPLGGDIVREVTYRRGSALLAAITIAVAFYGISLFFESYRYGVIGALLIGLLPQFAFIASYNNDDVGAIFSATLLVTALVRIYKKELDIFNAIFFGVACGLVVLSKQTAWLLAPTVVLFVLVFVRVSVRQLAVYAGVAALLFLLVGGWWLLFNVYHYTVDDPFLLKITREVSERHTRIPPNLELGFKGQGVGYADLLIRNHDNFWMKTIASTIGNLDWLRLRLGPWQYGLYLLVILSAFSYFVVGSVRIVSQVIKVGRWQAAPAIRVYLFEAILIFAIVFQFAAYVWTNINNDIQMQGKYLLPVFFAVVILFLSAFRAIADRVLQGMVEANGVIKAPVSTVRKWSFLFLGFLILVIHVDALIKYVIPFYKPPIYRITLKQPQKILLKNAQITQHSEDLERIVQDGEEVVIYSSGPDPWFVWDVKQAGLCRYFRGNVWLQIGVDSLSSGVFKVYVDKGYGFREEDSYAMKYSEGESELAFPLAAPKCLSLRFDPANAKGKLVIKGISLSGMRVTVDE